MRKFTIIISILLILLISISIFSGRSNNLNEATSSGYSKISARAPRVIYWGSSGDTVREAQRRLKDWGYYEGSVDGIYGPQMYRATRQFQRKHGLTVDGIIGPATANSLGISLGVSQAQTTGVTRDDNVYLLARAVHGEARGEPYVGKVAIAAVVLNRVENPSFPNSIAGVIYQPLAFTAVADGQMNLSPDNESLRAARDALNGWDPTYGCLYYWNPATATSKWIWSREKVIEIGKHWFGN
ncbi:spore cortex-lytic enzyme [Clostridium sp. D2Q-14]|uniref:spore cortex-lytic enzyme n=1 Tax=Anaeromonas gelatinilytica TaxID=2683194 RepID=UPI00193B1912|nr:spore cortex-lytic enzyme [Anaeromonas gelatinilytica]MBS4534935.1 spore cortex-lytic enzyme [Anaeromonas gelatinilytica]